MDKHLFSIEVDGHGMMVARIGQRELARVHVLNETAEAHITAARQLVVLAFEAFEDLQAQGYPRAYGDEKLSEKV